MNKEEILKRLSSLPKGGVTVKKIKSKYGKIYEYPVLQWYENGKRYSQRLQEYEVDEVKAKLAERVELEKVLNEADSIETSFHYNTNIRIGEELTRNICSVRSLKKRNGFTEIQKYVYGNEYNKVFILYGLRRTGKTTLIKQIIAEMDPVDFKKTAFIQIRKVDDLGKLNKDLKELEKKGFKYVFIDEVTLMADFIEGAALLSDIYAASGMKIVLSGTDSLGFWLSKSNELYDRCIFLHTTFISYREFETVLGIKGIDKFIQYGGTMSISGVHYNENVFIDKESTDEYIDSAIAQNIQHSLKCYQDEGHFRHLYSLYEQKELTNVINRVVEDINHRFTIEVLTKDFKSNDLSISARNLRKDRDAPTSILDDIDITQFTKRLMELLDIKNKNDTAVGIDETHILEIKEYLTALDMIQEIEIMDITAPDKGQKRIVFTQPGLRYSQAKSFIESLSQDKVFQALSFDCKKRVVERILGEIKGRMLEDIVLLETKIASPDKKVFKLQFANGEFDMVVWDPVNGGVELYEIKYSKETIKEQARHLIDEEKQKQTEFRYGNILKKAVLYRGETTELFNVSYVNVEEYLKFL